MRSELFSQEFLETAPIGGFGLQNSKMLKVTLDGGALMARQGTMVAYQGQVQFDYQSSGGFGKMLKKAVTGEGVDLMKVSGTGDVFFADFASDSRASRRSTARSAPPEGGSYGASDSAWG